MSKPEFKELSHGDFWMMILFPAILVFLISFLSIGTALAMITSLLGVILFGVIMNNHKIDRMGKMLKRLEKKKK
ncbi:hypothetical protein LCGC14_0476290 [marine sediment metagenome]|uniref:Uncharacterized protein n=1 Tax=marine sediment metagenome TaxID=412755 RepID=A0A0F9UXK7_9ZZZZ|nr:hypothetical protein [bacterium]